MSTTAIGKIIKEAGGAANDKKNAVKEAKQKTDEIVKELVNDSQQPQLTKKGPGRPKGSGTSPGRPKTPPRTLEEINGSPQFRAGLNPAEKIRNEMAIHKLRMYIRKFPEYSKFFEGYNPLEHHPDENEKIISSFLELIHLEVEFATAPAAICDAIQGAEQAAAYWAIKNPTHPAAKIVEDLSGASNAILSDKAVSLDIRLLECEITNVLPKNPKLRLCLNICRTLASHWSKNQLNTVSHEGPPSVASSETFKNL